EVPQGPLNVTAIATSGPTEAKTDAALFVRGRPGAVDTTFANGGTYLYQPHTYFDPFDMFVLPDDRILLPARAGNSGTALRLNSDGTLDKTYGNQGFAQFSTFDAFMMQGEKLLALGGHDSTIMLTRFTATGAVDTSFGSGTGAVNVATP